MGDEAIELDKWVDKYGFGSTKHTGDLCVPVPDSFKICSQVRLIQAFQGSASSDSVWEAIFINIYIYILVSLADFCSVLVVRWCFFHWPMQIFGSKFLRVVIGLFYSLFGCVESFLDC